MKPLPSPPPLPLSTLPPLSDQTPLVVRESSQAAAIRAADSDRIQAVTANRQALLAPRRPLDERACAALGVAFGLGLLVGYCAADKN